MTKKELKAQIRAKRKEISEQVSKGMRSQDAAEVRSINDTLVKLRADLDELEAQLDELEEQEEQERSAMPVMSGDPIPENAQLVNGNIRSGFFYGSGNTAAGAAESRVNGIGAFALRSNESLVSRVPKAERKTLDLGKYVRGAVTGNWNDATEERAAFTTSSTGVIIPQVLSAQVIDMARNVSLFTKAGVPIVPMETNNLTIARVQEHIEELEKEREALENPALIGEYVFLYALAEIVNIRDESLTFEPIHRVLFDTDVSAFIEEFGSQIARIPEEEDYAAMIRRIDAFCSSYLSRYGGSVDYIHNDDSAIEMGSRNGCAALLLPALKKERLFECIVKNGPFPKKSFSIGHASDKRYYMECRKLAD